MFVKGKLARYNFLDGILPGVLQLIKDRTLVVSKLDKERLFLVSKEMYNLIEEMKHTPILQVHFSLKLKGKKLIFHFGSPTTT